MTTNLFWEFQNASTFEYINLLPQSKARMEEISKLAEKLFINSFRLELQKDIKKEDEKESSYQEFSRYKTQVDRFYTEMKSEREELKHDEEIGKLYGKVESEMRSWETKYDRVALSSKMAFQNTRQILSCLVPNIQFLRQKQEREKQKIGACNCKGALKKIASKTCQYLEKYQQLKQQILPRVDSMKAEILKEIITNFEEAFMEEIESKIILSDQGKKKIQYMENKQNELKKFITSVIEQKYIDDPDDQTLYEFIQKQGFFKLEIQNEVKWLNQKREFKKELTLFKLEKSQFRTFLGGIISVQMAKSKFLIQPINGSNKYLIADVTNPSLAKTEYIASFKFPMSSGFIHLSQSLVIAGGGQYLNTVHQIYENHVLKSLPSMRLKRIYFPLVSFNDGKTIVAICGSFKKKIMNQCQNLKEFKKWSDLPNTIVPFAGASACSVGSSTVFIFGGANSMCSEGCIQRLDLNALDKNWSKIDVPFNPFIKRDQDAAVYLEEKKKILVFGSLNGKFFVQINVKDDMSIEIEQPSIELPFDYSQYKLLIWKKYKGCVYSFGSKKDKVWRYDGRKWE